MILNFLPIFLIGFWLYYGFTNDLDEILIIPPIFLLIPYFFLVTKIRSIRVMKKLSPFDTPITNGHIERGLNSTFAIIAERDKGKYRLYYNGNKKNRASFQYEVIYPKIPKKPKIIYFIFN